MSLWTILKEVISTIKTIKYKIIKMEPKKVGMFELSGNIYAGIITENGEQFAVPSLQTSKNNKKKKVKILWSFFNISECQKITLEYAPNTDLHYVLRAYQSLIPVLKLKVNSIENSKKLGFQSLKEKLKDKKLTFAKVQYNEIENVFYFLTNVNGNLIRFDYRDLEFDIPDFRGYKLPKDRSIAIGKQAKIIRDQKTIFKKGELVVITDIAKNLKTPQRHYITVVQLTGNKKGEVFKRNIKII